MSTAANRGKYAEGEVKKYLKLLESSHMNFTFNRNLDAHAAGGKFQAQAGDFQAFVAIGTAFLKEADSDPRLYTEKPVRLTRNFIIEVKECKLPNRLPYQNYSADKVARVNKRVHAGTEAIVLVCLMPDKLWRAVPQEFFNIRNPDKPSGSWDLSGFEFVDMKRALSEFLGVLP